MRHNFVGILQELSGAIMRVNIVTNSKFAVGKAIPGKNFPPKKMTCVSNKD
jgi:hypothetical protein